MSDNIMLHFEEVLKIGTRRILAGTMEDSDRILLYKMALAVVGERILSSEDILTLVGPDVLAALHQLTLLADPDTTAEDINMFAESLVEPEDLECETCEEGELLLQDGVCSRCGRVG